MNPATPTGDQAPGGGSALLDNFPDLQSDVSQNPSHTQSRHDAPLLSEYTRTRGPLQTFVRLDAAQEIARLYTDGHRTEHCQLDVSPGQSVEVMKREDGSVSLSGFRPCGSPHCPHCSRILAIRRALETEEIVRAAFDRGFLVSLVTVTTDHHANESLADVLQGLTASWSACSQGYGRTAFKAALGDAVGNVRALETTHGDSGWHPHLHVLLIHRAPVDADAVFERYRNVSARFGRTPNRGGFDVVPVSPYNDDVKRLSSYVSGRKASRWNAATETAGGALKQSEHGRTLGDLLDAFIEDGDADAAELYAEYLDATKGVSVWRTSSGLRAKLGLEVEKTDEEIMEELEKRGTPIMQLTRTQAVALAVTCSRGAFLRTVQTQGVDAGRDFLTKAVGLAFGRRRRPHAA